MTKFFYNGLDVRANDDFLKEISERLQAGSRNDIAVAYWGRGATTLLKLDGTRPTRVVCDLLSGGCNPYEIRSLLVALKDDKGTNVRYFDRLHAKVYLTDRCAVVGSANASSNGLSSESSNGTFEAAICTENPQTVAKAANWFDTLWQRSSIITDERLRLAEEAWRRQPSRPQAGETLLGKYFSEPEWFRQMVCVTYYVTEASEKAIRKFEEVKSEYYSPHELKSFSDRNYPLYDLDVNDVPPEMIGTFVIDAAERAVYSILRIEQYSKQSCAVLLRREKSVLGLSVPQQQLKWLKAGIKRHLGKPETDAAWNLEEMPAEVHQYVKEHFLATIRLRAGPTAPANQKA